MPFTNLSHPFVQTSLINFSLYSTIFAGKLIPVIPKIVPNGAQVALSFTGIRTLPETYKTLHLHIDNISQYFSLYSAMKVIQVAGDTFLLLANTFAATLALAGKATVALSIYHFLITPSLVLLVTQIGLHLFRYIEAKQTLNTARLLPLLERHEIKEYNKNPKQLNAIVYRIRNVAAFQLGLIAYGYIALAIGRAYPQTLLSATIYWSTSALYTCKTLYEYAQPKKMYS